MSAFFIYKCSNQPFNFVESLFNYTDEYCQQDTNCLVDISKITPFKWDTLYVIDKGWTRHEIEALIGTAFPEKMDIFSKLIFVKNGQVVYSDEYYYLSDFAGHVGGNKILTLNFEYENQKKGLIAYYRISKDDPKVLIYTEYNSQKTHYLFSPSNESQVKRLPGKFWTPS
ncbi:hypothetical protein ABLB69_19525 [Xenorhabdus khoisanae]|uniref:hypothetical protein n=1 Tax=Xenorhabdus khoisanae TaxID=880157 RepID=UPI0032B71737